VARAVHIGRMLAFDSEWPLMTGALSSVDTGARSGISLTAFMNVHEDILQKR
jgi:hypothetical protein